MAVCVAVVNNALTVSTTALGSCTDYVLLTAADYAASTPQLTTDDWYSLSWMVVSVWAVAWSIKILRRAL